MLLSLRTILSIGALVMVCAASADEPPLMESSCAAGGLVDPVFRDTALVALERLVVHAPGQAAHGAIRSHHSAGHFDARGRAWHLISAYQVNLGLIGVVRVAPRMLPVAAEWLRWQARHISVSGDSRGVALDHWVRADDFEESTCPSGLAQRLCGEVDAFDSTAASTLLMADAYLRYGGDAEVLREPRMRQALAMAAAAMSDLTGADGLTWAKPTHRVVYTMDAVEVIAGWRAWARVQRNAYADPQAADTSRAVALRGEAALQQRLWDNATGAWRVSLGVPAARVRPRWYPDTVAQAWPLLWGIEPAPGARASESWRRAISHWQGKTHWARNNVDPAGFWWPAAAVAAACTGDVDSARTWVARARASWLNREDPFAWPFQVGDLLWLLWLADPP